MIATGHRRRARRAAHDRAERRRLPARTRGPRTRAHRHQQPARAVQPGARLLHRGDQRPARQGPAGLPAPPDDEERRAVHHARAEGIRRQGAVGAGARTGAREGAVGGAARRAGSARDRAGGAGTCAGHARRAERPVRARADAALVHAAVCRPSVHRHSARAPSGGGGATGRDPGHALHRQRLPARCTHAHAGDHRPEHGRQEHLHAPGGADRAAGLDGLVRARRCLRARADRCDPHPHRRRRRPRQCAVDLHAGDDRGGSHRACGHRTLAWC